MAKHPFLQLVEIHRLTLGKAVKERYATKEKQMCSNTFLKNLQRRLSVSCFNLLVDTD